MNLDDTLQYRIEAVENAIGEIAKQQKHCEKEKRRLKQVLKHLRMAKEITETISF